MLLQTSLGRVTRVWSNLRLRAGNVADPELALRLPESGVRMVRPEVVHPQCQVGNRFFFSVGHFTVKVHKGTETIYSGSGFGSGFGNV
jgi:hypothetical protein